MPIDPKKIAGVKLPGGIAKTPGEIAKTAGGIAKTPGGIAKTPGGITKTPGGITKPPAGDTTTPVKLVPGVAVTSATAKLVVAAMPPGTYTFQLDVTDNLGATSRATVKVQVKPPVIG